MNSTIKPGGLWVGKKYAQTGKRMPEPIKGLSHAATASQVCRFYYQLAMGNLVSREMLEILVNPEIDHKFVNTLKKPCPGPFCSENPEPGGHGMLTRFWYGDLDGGDILPLRWLTTKCDG